MDTPANQIPGFSYDAGTMNVGASLAAGMEAGSKVGEQIGKGITGAAEIFNQNRTADDTLAAMHQSGMLSADAYNAVAGKSLGAKQQMLGMYASQWINQQAQERDLQKIGYTGQVQTEVERAKLLDNLSMIRAGYPGLAGIKPGSLPVQRNGAQAQAPRAQPVIPNLGGSVANATPLGSADITNPLAQSPASVKVTMGQPIGGKTPIPQGWQPYATGGRHGYMENPQGWNPIFHPFQPGG